MNKTELTAKIKQTALNLGFPKVGIAPAEATGEDERLRAWLHLGDHADMDWMTRHTDKRLDPTQLVPGARSIISVAMNYFTDHRPSTCPPPNQEAISLYKACNRFFMIS